MQSRKLVLDVRTSQAFEYFAHVIPSSFLGKPARRFRKKMHPDAEKKCRDAFKGEHGAPSKVEMNERQTDPISNGDTSTQSKLVVRDQGSAFPGGSDL